MKKIASCVFVVGFFFIVGSVFSDQVKSSVPVIELSGGAKGDITFPHEIHQKALTDCQICHSIYPQKIKGISASIKSGKMEKKQAMGECIKCHRTNIAENKKTGPVSCGECHKK